MLKKYSLFFFLFLLFFTSAFSYIKLYDGWEYKWESEKEWHKYENPGIPIENKGEELLLRYKLPDVTFEEPAIYIRGILNFFTLYIGNKVIYSNISEESYFSPKSIFKIPDNFQNKYLLLKITSKKRDVGFFGEFLLGNEKELLTHQIVYESDRLILIAFNIFIGFLAFIFAIYFWTMNKSLNEGKLFLYLGIFSISLSTFIMGQNQTFKYFYDNPVFWAYLMDIGKYLSPIGILRFFYNIFDYSSKKYIRILIKAHLIIFAGITLIQIFTGIEPNYYVKYVLLLYLLMIIDIMLMIYYMYIGISRFKDRKAYIFSFSIVTVSIFTIYEILGDFRIIKWERPLIQWSIFILINSMIIMSLKNIKDLNLELSVKNKILEIRNADLDKEVSKRTKEIKMLLDNSGEGFLVFDENFIIDDTYSKECLKIFDGDIGKKNILDLLFSEDKDFVKRIFEDIFAENDSLRKEVYFSFLPEEILFKEKYYNLRFKEIDFDDKKKIMLVLKDITNEKALEQAIQTERENLNKIIIVIQNYDAFMYNLKDFKYFISHGYIEIFESKNSKNEKNFEIHRAIHTYKGVFAQFYLTQISYTLHLIENEIIKAIEKKTFSQKYFEKLLFEKFNIYEKLSSELDILKEALGEEFLNDEEKLKIPKSKIIELENKVLKYFENEKAKKILKDIRKLRYKKIDDLLKPYLQYSKELATRLGKVINYPQIIQDEDVYIDPDKYFEFIKSLVHVFRNIIDHGIEIPELRIEKGKTEYGNITIRIFKEDGLLKIDIKDDGSGIDKNQLIAVANRKNIPYDKEKIFDIIFHEGFSTKVEVTEISGRGIGLNVVKKEVEKLNGKVYVESEIDKGTIFHFEIPEEDI
ncbi:hypothetical protein XO10_09945 [Marinitoga sp. 1135]|uniref:ATP-binding protein n=1 Tax=Marinitoga sp. 1135 TaxID=1643333 RepID=UPI0015869C80|nr:ATP-binding protein [Marinitoga sp. 1135]NUU96554.1 hypothetical protein [Marinitoga sp. 1135]